MSRQIERKVRTIHQFWLPLDIDLVARVVCALQNNGIQCWAYTLNAYEVNEQGWWYCFEFVPEADTSVLRDIITQVFGFFDSLKLNYMSEWPVVRVIGLPTSEAISEHLEDKKDPQTNTHIASIIRTAQNAKNVKLCVAGLQEDRGSFKAALKTHAVKLIDVINLTLYIRIESGSILRSLNAVINALPHGDADIYGFSVSWFEPYRRLSIAVSPACSRELNEVATNLGTEMLGLPKNNLGYRILLRDGFLITSSNGGFNELCKLLTSLAQKSVLLDSLYTVVGDFVQSSTFFSMRPNPKQ